MASNTFTELTELLGELPSSSSAGTEPQAPSGASNPVAESAVADEPASSAADPGPPAPPRDEPRAQQAPNTVNIVLAHVSQMPPSARFVIEVPDKLKDLYKSVWMLGCEDGNVNHDSGVDVRFPEDVSIAGGEVKRIDLGVRVALLQLHWNPHSPSPVGTRTAFLLVPRSSIAHPARPFNWGDEEDNSRPMRAISMPNAPGLIDVGYNGTLKVQLYNNGREAVKFNRGDSVVQVAAANLSPAEYCCADVGSALACQLFAHGTRGAGGFGSTGAAGSSA